MVPEQTYITTLQATFRSARRFGLTEKETWRAADDALLAVGTDATVSEFLDELVATLARGILLSERDASQAHLINGWDRDAARFRQPG